MSRVTVDAALVSRLVAAQLPRWAGLPVTPVVPGGWDNRTFRLGRDMSVRLPSAAAYAAQVDKEQQWLPRLAPHLPLPVPQPLARGEPGEGYPWPWSVHRWLEGEPAQTLHPVRADVGFAVALAEFLRALRVVDPTGGPAAGEHSFFRGGDLAVYDDQTRDAIRALDGVVDRARVARVWQDALSSRWRRRPVWVHGDISAGNLLVRDGRLAAVLDFGCSAVGDPACDTAIAWTFLSGAARTAFRREVDLDADTWRRGRGWALWKSLITMAGARDTDPAAFATARHTLRQVLADAAQPS